VFSCETIKQTSAKEGLPPLFSGIHSEDGNRSVFWNSGKTFNILRGLFPKATVTPLFKIKIFVAPE
jgi:hypothetical protein